MNIHAMAQRLQMTVAGFARAAGVSRATVNAWRADPHKPYSAVPRPQTLRDMADSLEVHGEEARKVAEELRAAAETGAAHG